MLGDLRGSFSSVRNVMSGTMNEYFTRTLQELYKSLNDQLEHSCGYRCDQLESQQSLISLSHILNCTNLVQNRLKTLRFVLKNTLFSLFLGILVRFIAIFPWLIVFWSFEEKQK